MRLLGNGLSNADPNEDALSVQEAEFGDAAAPWHQKMNVLAAQSQSCDHV